MKPVGGYFELELNHGGNTYHNVPHTFKSARAALHYLLQLCKPKRVYVPFYTCNALFEPFAVAGVPYELYAIDERFEPVALPELADEEYFLYIDYFGLKQETVNSLSDKYGDKLIVDCTQAFFTKGNGRSWYYNSCRKFFGVPDGAYLYAPDGVPLEVAESSNEDYTVEHLIKRFNGHAQDGYAAFQQNEKLCGPEIKRMSTLSEYLLSNIDYSAVIARRRANFECLHQIFKTQNQLSIFQHDNAMVPMFYPLLPAHTVNRNELYRNELFVPTLWAEVTKANDAKFETERNLAERLLPLPIDHRYSETDMKRMAAVIQLSK